MEIEWIEDFLCLAEARSFSRAASIRHSSQPAFSRRIQALESWLGVELVDRSTNPPTLTPSGRAFRGFAKGIVAQLYQARDQLRGKTQIPPREIRIAIAYTLSLTFFPDWFAELHKCLGGTTAKVSEMNVMEGASALMAGEVDFLICYHHPRLPVLLDLDRFPYIGLGKESFQPYSAADERGEPIYLLPGQRDAPLPLLSYAPGTFFIHVVDMLLLNAPQPYALDCCYQGQMSEALKAMVVAGNGIAWLPEKCVMKELIEGAVTPAGSEKWGTELEIRMFRCAENRHPVVERCWDLLTG